MNIVENSIYKIYFYCVTIFFFLSSLISCNPSITYENVKSDLANRYDIDTNGILIKNIDLNDKCELAFTWYKAQNKGQLFSYLDLDNDGRKDYIISRGLESHSVKPLILLVKPNSKISKIYPYFKRHLDCNFASTITVNEENLILYSKSSNIDYYRGYKVDTLKVLNNMILNYRRNNILTEVRSIQFVNVPTWGSYKDSIFINFQSNKFSKCKVGLYEENITCEDNSIASANKHNLSEVLATIKLDSDRKKYLYEVDWTDDDTAITTVTLKDGTIYSFEDYGLYGDASLNQLYKELFKL